MAGGGRGRGWGLMEERGGFIFWGGVCVWGGGGGRVRRERVISEWCVFLNRSRPLSPPCRLHTGFHTGSLSTVVRESASPRARGASPTDKNKHTKRTSFSAARGGYVEKGRPWRVRGWVRRTGNAPCERTNPGPARPGMESGRGTAGAAGARAPGRTARVGVGRSAAIDRGRGGGQRRAGEVQVVGEGEGGCVRWLSAVSTAGGGTRERGRAHGCDSQSGELRSTKKKAVYFTFLFFSCL